MEFIKFTLPNCGYLVNLPDMGISVNASLYCIPWIIFMCHVAFKNLVSIKSNRILFLRYK